MPRNFVRRVEVMFPIESEEIRRRIVDEIIPIYLRDNQRARILHANGIYKPATAGSTKHRSQVELLALAASREAAAEAKNRADIELDPFAALPAIDGQWKRDGAKRRKKKSPSTK
jgi:polyphosphate kinase